MTAPERNVFPDKDGSQALATPLLQMALALGKASSSPVVGPSPPSPSFLLAAWSSTDCFSIISTHNICFTEAAWMCVTDFLKSFPKEHRKAKPFLFRSNPREHVHHLIPSLSASTVYLQVTQRGTHIQTVQHCQGGSGTYGRPPTVPAGSSDGCPSCPVLLGHRLVWCVHHIWPLFETPPQSIS